jgi:hypothetical protein
VKDNRDLNGPYLKQEFLIQHDSRQEIRGVRLVNMGGNHRLDEELAICHWEIFGTLHKQIADDFTGPVFRFGTGIDGFPPYLLGKGISEIDRASLREL